MHVTFIALRYPRFNLMVSKCQAMSKITCVKIQYSSKQKIALGGANMILSIPMYIV